MSQTGWTPVQEGGAPGWTPVPQGAAAPDNKGLPSTGGNPAARPGAMQTRPGGPILNTNDSVLQEGTGAFLRAFGIDPIAAREDPSIVHAAGHAAAQVGQGIGKMVEPMYKGRDFRDPTAPFMGAVDTLYGMGKGLMQNINQTAYSLGSKNTHEFAAGAGQLGALEAGKMGEKVGGVFSPATEQGAMNSLFDRRYTALDNAYKFGLGKALKQSVARVGAEIGENVQSISAADKAMNASQGTPGTLSTMEALRVSKDMIDKYSKLGVTLPKIAQTYDQLSETAGKPVDFDTMKAIRTNIGDRMRAAYKADPTSPEYAALRDINKSLTEQMQGRALELGKQSEWSQYNKLTQQLDAVQKGPVGDMLSADNGYDFMKSMLEQKTGNVKLGVFKALEPYGIDDKFYGLAKESAGLVKQLENEGKFFNWKARLGVAGGLAAVGVSRPFMAAYAAMAGADAVKSLFSRDAAASVEAMTPGAPQPSEPPINPPLKGNKTPFGPALSQVQAAKAAKGSPTMNLVTQQTAPSVATNSEPISAADTPGQRYADASAKTRKALQVEQATKAKSGVPDAPNPTPDRRILVGRGADGQIAIEFPDQWHKDLFSAPGRSYRQFSGKTGGTAPDFDRLANHFGVSRAEVVKLAHEYKERIMGAVKDKPEGSRYVAPSTKEPE